MRTLYRIAVGCFLLSTALTSTSLAQRSMFRSGDYEAITSYRISTQGVKLDGLNQALQQAGYGTLPNQVSVLSVASQFTRKDKPFSFLTEIGLTLSSGTSVTNGVYKAQATYHYVKVGTAYRLINTGRFQLAPQIGLMSIPFRLQVERVNNLAPTLNTILASPGSAETATLRTYSLGLDAGLTAMLQIPYSQRQTETDCITTTTERSFVIGLDAGYRVSSRAPLNSAQEVSANNPAVQFSGWYAGIRIGFGARIRTAKSSPIGPLSN